MIFGYALQYGSGSTFLSGGWYWDDPVMKAIYSVYMPLFIAVSGYLYWFSMQSHGSVQSALRRIRQLLPVCIVWGIALWLLRIASGKSGDFKSLARLCITGFWLLWTLMISACVASLVECVAPRKALARIAMYGVLLGAAFFTTDLYWLNAHKFMLFLFAAGVCCGRYGCKWLLGRMAAVVSLLTWCALIPFYTRDSLFI